MACNYYENSYVCGEDPCKKPNKDCPVIQKKVQNFYIYLTPNEFQKWVKEKNLEGVLD